MPWKETNVMEQREMFIKAWLSRRYTKIELCQQFNISRPTADKWIKRHEQVGFEGLAELSRRPHHSPNATPQWIVEWLMAERLKRPDWGAKKLLDMFAYCYPQVKRPADSTGDLILARAGLVEPRKRKRRISADTQPFGDCLEASAVWCTDFKGEFKLGNKQLCYPLTVTDLFSRNLFVCEALPNTRACNVFTIFDRLFREFGLPVSIRSDNGTPFASTAIGGISRLSKLWIDLGIRPQRIKPSHPEQNGQHERMHRSLKTALFKRQDGIRHTLSEQQAVFDDSRKEYNEVRSHEGLNRQRPVDLYQPSKRQYTGNIEPYEYESHQTLRLIKQSGEIKWQGNTYYLSQVLANEPIAFEPYADGIWRIYYRFMLLGEFHEREQKIVPFTQWHSGTM